MWWLTDDEKKILVKIILVGFFFRLIFFILADGVSWDSPRYLEQAENLFKGYIGQEKSEFGTIGRYVLPPIYPLLISVFIFFTKSPVFSGKLVSLLASTAEIIVIYYLAKFLFGKRQAKYASLLVTLYPNFWLTSAEVVIESTATLFLNLSILSLLWALKKEKGGILFGTGLLFGIATLTKPASIFVFFVLVIFVILFKKLKANQLFISFAPFITLILTYLLLVKHVPFSDFTYYPKTVISENLYLEGILPDVFTLNEENSTLKFIDNKFTILSLILSNLATYIFLVLKTVFAGVKFMLAGDLFILITTILVWRRFLSKKYINKRSNYLKNDIFIFLPIIASILFYALTLTHGNFISRLLFPVLPLYFILAADGLVNLTLDKFSLMVIKLMIFPTILVILAIPLVKKLFIIEGDRFTPRKKFIYQVAQQIKMDSAGSIMTNISDGRKIVYLAERKILYLPSTGDYNSLKRYAEFNYACCIFTDKKIGKDFPEIKLRQSFEPFANSTYKLYFYKFDISDY